MQALPVSPSPHAFHKGDCIVAMPNHTKLSVSGRHTAKDGPTLLLAAHGAWPSAKANSSPRSLGKLSCHPQQPRYHCAETTALAALPQRHASPGSGPTTTH